MQYQRILWLFVLIVLAACKKEYPVSSTGNPVFYFNGTISGSPVNLQAGVNDYYMYASFVQDTNNVYNFYGDLKQTNCTNCTNRIQFQINDYKVSALNASAVIDTSLKPAYYPLQVTGGALTTYAVNFTSIPSDSGQKTYAWDFGDGATSLLPNPSHVYANPGTYSVCLTITYYMSSCVSNICKAVQVGVGNGCNLQLTLNGINPTDSSLCDGTATGAVTGGGTPPYSYNWSTGQTTQTAIGLCNGCYTLTVTDANGCSTLANICIADSTTTNGCFTNFSCTVPPANPNPFALSNVTITWTDNSGTVYTSNDSSQTGDSYFQIVSVENYLNNQNNQPTKKLHVKFKGKVYNGINFHQIDNGDAVIAVAYK